MKRGILYIGVSVLIIGLFLVLFSTWNRNYERVQVVSGENQLDVRIYEGSEDLVLITHGFSSDKNYNIRLANTLHRNGFTVVLFDFRGHGLSEGTIGFDNAQTDALSYDISVVVDYLNEEGYSNESMTLIGHSMGARSIMQYATKGNSFKQLILVGPEINLLPNTQSSFFTGANDSEMPFVDRMDASSPMSDVYIITSTIDDISPVENAELLIEKLNEGSTVDEYDRELIIVDNVLHNYELLSSKVINNIVDILSANGDYHSFRYVYSWYIGLFLVLISPILIYKSMHEEKKENVEEGIMKGFYKKRLLYWLMSIVVLAVLVGISMVLPMPKPFFSVQFVYIVGGYGIVSLFFLRKQKVYTLIEDAKNIDWRKSYKALLIALVFTVISYIVRYSAFSIVFRSGYMVIWYVLFVSLMSLGFYVLSKDSEYVLKHAKKKSEVILWNVIKYFPFYLFAVGYIALGSVSGITTSAQGLLFLLFGVYVSKIIRDQTSNDVLAAIVLSIIIAVPFGSVF